MDIYSPKVLSDRTIQNFLPSRLAIKELAGKLYFCKSTKANIESYTGSGIYWKKRIKKYGKENVKTLWVSDWYHCPHEIQEVALHFSRENQIVENERWANIKPENGLDGGGVTPDIIAKIAASKKANGTENSNSPESIAKMLATKKKNGTMNSNTASSVAKALATRKENGTMNPNTPENRAQTQATKKKNGTLNSSPKVRAKCIETFLSRPKHIFVHTTGIVEVCTQFEMKEKYNLCSGNLNSMIKRKKGHDSVKGWSIKDELPATINTVTQDI
jgi:hypothetical protein